jgi:molecular chaperone DnaJ
MRLRLKGKGEAAPPGGDAGDLYVVLMVEDHPSLQREGETLVTDLNVDFVTACLGGTLVVDGLVDEVEVEVPSGTQPDDILHIRGEGMPALNGHTRGELLVRIIVEIPKKLNAEQRSHLEAFRKSSNEA